MQRRPLPQERARADVPRDADADAPPGRGWESLGERGGVDPAEDLGASSESSDYCPASQRGAASQFRHGVGTRRLNAPPVPTRGQKEVGPSVRGTTEARGYSLN